MFTQVLTDISFDVLKMPPTLMERQDVKISFHIVFQLVIFNSNLFFTQVYLNNSFDL